MHWNKIYILHIDNRTVIDSAKCCKSYKPTGYQQFERNELFIQIPSHISTKINYFNFNTCTTVWSLPFMLKPEGTYNQAGSPFSINTCGRSNLGISP